MAQKPFSQVPPPRRKSIRPIIMALKPGFSELIADAAAGSVKSIISRIHGEDGNKRRFTSEKQDGGVRVWRLA